MLRVTGSDIVKQRVISCPNDTTSGCMAWPGSGLVVARTFHAFLINKGRKYSMEITAKLISCFPIFQTEYFQ